MNAIHEANRKGWDAISASWQARVEAAGLWRRCPEQPMLALHEREMAWLAGVADKDVCVLGSGDNLVVFALAGMGARVTSVDISQEQLWTAGRRARELGLEVRFVQADVTDLETLGSESFDVVYTGGHVAVWVSDLRRYYAEAARILAPGGLFLVNEYHPFRRIWKWGADRLELDAGYFERGPFEYDRAEDVPGAEAGSLLSYEHRWTVSDYVSAMLGTGCRLLAVEEFGENREPWEEAPLAGLPRCLLLAGRKP